MSGADELKWARRVPQHLIRRLYVLDAKGIMDEELVDEVGYAMYARCESIRTVTEAHAGRPACPRCGAALEHRWKKHEVLSCACGWEATWGEYLKSYQRKQLHGGSGYPAFLEFLERWPKAHTSRDKLLAIDRLVHACHGSARFGATRPTAVNLIEGTMHDVLGLLDELAYSDLSTSGTAETRAAWEQAWRLRTWGRPEPPS